MMLGLLLARPGVGVQVLEKHADFLRDFRGDTIHPSTLEVMHELGCSKGCCGCRTRRSRAFRRVSRTATSPFADLFTPAGALRASSR